MSRELYVGLMSGTSLDGIDAVVVDFAQQPPCILAAATSPLPDALRTRLMALCQPGDNEIERMGQTDRLLGEALAAASLEIVAAAGEQPAAITAIGSHGQTIRHRPDAPSAFTLQIGDPATIAERTGITTVADFRRRDVAAGGQGAPLVPLFHRAVFAAAGDSVVVNIGGIANISVLLRDSPVTGFDTGPGNGLLDAWISQHHNTPFDADGEWAASGQVHNALLQRLLEEPFLSLPAPRSTGRELFNLAWLHHHLSTLSTPPELADVQATLAQFTARTIADAIIALPRSVDVVYVCGGGAYNHDLMDRLGRLLHPRLLRSTAALGLAPEWVEATAFAWLARQTMLGRPGSEPAVTGAAGARILGAIHQA